MWQRWHGLSATGEDVRVTVSRVLLSQLAHQGETQGWMRRSRRLKGSGEMASCGLG